MTLIFFTDVNTSCSNYCLLNIKKYNNKNKFSKKLIFIDPSVHELVNSIEYSNVELLHALIQENKLKNNEFLSIDYPCDMNPRYSLIFIDKTNRNNYRYYKNMHYINTIQSAFQDFSDFVENWKINEDLFLGRKKIVGLGNLCRILHPNKFTDKLFSFLNEKLKKNEVFWLHFYGLGFRVIVRYFRKLQTLSGEYDILNTQTIVSTDSTKWTRQGNKRGTIHCNSCNRNEYFIKYIRKIEKVTRIRIVF